MRTPNDWEPWRWVLFLMAEFAAIAREEKKRRRRRLISIILILIGAAMLAFELAGCATPTFCERDGWGPFPGDPVYKQGIW